MKVYGIVIEDAGSNFAAYAPDVPGCVATGESVEEVTANMETALAMHFELLRENGESIPEPLFRAGLATVSL
ncbi:MAG: type II toxin-antitoxin system HicB family antitoxin [Actinobacteria bacterium]|nr:type II toxin-antitoxin system HicB family antitoxin [Actinomycetota bacterium]